MRPKAAVDSAWIDRMYAVAAQRYLEALPQEHFMESTDQSTQRKITMESFDVIHTMRPDIQCLSELLVLYPVAGKDKRNPAGVVLDNMVFVHPKPLEKLRSFNTPNQSVLPTLVLEYLSFSNPRKDRNDNFHRYQDDLRIPYYLLFNPDMADLQVYKLTRRKYVEVAPNAAKWLPIPDLELEVALRDTWVRFWFRGKLMPLPADLTRELAEAQSRAETAERAKATAQRRAQIAEQAKEAADKRIAELEAELARIRSTGNGKKNHH